MYEKELTLTVSTQDITSCSICYARNYDTTHPDPLGERVDRLYELRIGGQVMVLCDKCLDRLREKLAQHVHAEEEHEARNDGFYDEVGGYHEGGCGTDPNGNFCGECSNSSCVECPFWHCEQEGGAQLE